MFVRNTYTANGAISEKEGLIVAAPVSTDLFLTLASPSACDDGRELTVYYVDNGSNNVTVTTASGSVGLPGTNPWTTLRFISSGSGSFPNTVAATLLAYAGQWTLFQTPTTGLSIS